MRSIVTDELTSKRAIEIEESDRLLREKDLRIH